MSEEHRPVCAAVIGVGAMGQHHARVYDQMPGTQLVGIADADAESGDRIAQLRHTVTYTDYRRLLDEARPEVVTVAVPTEFHHQVALDALEAGCHVLVEKPIAATEEQARELIERANVLGRKLMVGHIVQADLGPVDCLTAELVKTMENAYRDVQIAFANEMALLCEDMGADVWQVRELVNKSPYRAMHLPGAGMGGHCIPKDSWLGYAYRENTDDTRNSPSQVLVARLKELGAEVSIHDPWVPEYRGDLEERVQGCDAIVVMVAHDTYRTVDLDSLRAGVARPILIDGRNVFSAEHAQAAGWDYRSVGNGMVWRPAKPACEK